MICPNCSQSQLVPIIYGYPTADLIEQAKLDKVVLGGVVFKEYTHFCHECQDTYPFPESN